MRQSKRHSFIESSANIAVGYLVGLGSQMLILPLFGIHISIKDNLLMSLYFTIISFVRSYALRRWFTARTSVSRA